MPKIAKHKIFGGAVSKIATAGSGKMKVSGANPNEVCEFLTGLGPWKIISVETIRPIVIVWYWELIDEEKEEAKESQRLPGV